MATVRPTIIDDFVEEVLLHNKILSEFWLGLGAYQMSWLSYHLVVIKCKRTLHRHAMRKEGDATTDGRIGLLNILYAPTNPCHLMVN